MENSKEMVMINVNFTESYERFIKGYKEYKAERVWHHSDEEGERNDNSSGIEQSQG